VCTTVQPAGIISSMLHDTHERTNLPGCRRVVSATNVSTSIRELLELIAALDRRVPHVQRAGEASIARDAAALKARALKRLKELGGEPPSAE